MQSNIATELIQFIKTSPSAFHAVDTMKKEFLANGFTALAENERWNLKAGGQYFITRNDSSIIAFLFRKMDFTVCASWLATVTLLPLKLRKIQKWKWKNTISNSM